MANFVYVDNSNVWIEGMRVAAVAAGEAPDVYTPMRQDLIIKWQLDFAQLLDLAGGLPLNIGRAVLYGSRSFGSDSFWRAAQAKGFETVVFDRNSRNREKQVDISIATDMVADSFELMRPGRDEITLVAGDSDYVPAVKRIRKRGIDLHVVFWSHAARELINAATSFTPLDEHLDLLTHR